MYIGDTQYPTLLTFDLHGKHCKCFLLDVTSSFLISADRLYKGDLNKVLGHVYSARCKWMQIGIALDMDPDDLEAIKVEFYDVGSWFTHMLIQWLTRVFPQPSWDAMIKALKEPHVGYPQLAEKVEQMVYPTRVAKVAAVVQGITLLPMVKNVLHMYTIHPAM